MTAVITISAVTPATDILTSSIAHGLNTGDGFLAIYTPAGTIPGGLATVTDYWAIKVDATNFKLASSSTLAVAGTAIDITTAGSGTLQILRGLPYRRPRIAAAGVQVASADDNDAWLAQVAMWNLLTGQPQTIWSGVTIAVALIMNATATFGAAVAINSTGSTITNGSEPGTTPLLQLRDWKSQARTTIDHLGFRGGQVTEWEEQWRTAGAPASPWTAVGTGTAAVCAIVDPTATLNQRQLNMVPGTDTTGAATATSLYAGYLDNNTAVVMEWTQEVVGLGGTTLHMIGGLQFSGNAGADFAYFNVDGLVGSFWQGSTVVNGAVGSTASTVAIAANTKYRFRIECLGSGHTSQAAGTYQFKFYINGTLVATRNQTTVGGAKFAPYFKNYAASATANGSTTNIGRVKLSFSHLLASDAV